MYSDFLLLDHKLLIWMLVGVLACIGLYMLVRVFITGLALNLEYGFTRNYLLHSGTSDLEPEWLIFPARHLKMRQLLFLIVCMIASKSSPDVPLLNLSNPTMIHQSPSNPTHRTGVVWRFITTAAKFGRSASRQQ